MTGFKKNNPDCVCCEQDGEGDPCEWFTDDFNRADSSTIGNGWTGVGAIANNRLELNGSQIVAPVSGGGNKLYSVTLYFSSDIQEARVYFAGTNNYVGVRLTNYDSSTKKDLYIVANGSMVAATDILGLPGVPTAPKNFRVCVTATQVFASFDGWTVTYGYPGSGVPNGTAGLGSSGSFSNGPVMFDDYSISVVGQDCYDCTNDDCVACSGEFSWLADLTGFTGMTDIIAFPGSVQNCAECADGFSSVVLDPSGPCAWSYGEVFCDGFDPLPNAACGTIELTVGMRTNLFSGGTSAGGTVIRPAFDARNCGGILTVQLNHTYLDGCALNYRQRLEYVADQHSLDLAGSGVVVFRKRVPTETFSAPGGFSPVCSVIDGPDTITVTRL